MVKRLENAVNMNIKDGREKLIKHIVRLDAISPLKVMQRGFALPVDDEGVVIKSVTELDKKKNFELKLTDGSRRCSVLKEG